MNKCRQKQKLPQSIHVKLAHKNNYTHAIFIEIPESAKMSRNQENSKNNQNDIALIFHFEFIL